MIEDHHYFSRHHHLNDNQNFTVNQNTIPLTNFLKKGMVRTPINSQEGHTLSFQRNAEQVA